jgi:S1-C subfamily serine protease
MYLRNRSVALLGVLGLLGACAGPTFAPGSDNAMPDVEPVPGAADGRPPIQAEPLEATSATADPSQRLAFGARLVITSDEIAERVSMESAKGLFVIDVEQGGAAAMAGIHAGDVLLMFAGAPVNTEEDIKAALALVRPQDIELVGIWRNGEQRVLVVTF